MTVVVSFFRPAAIGPDFAPGVGAVRVRENITIPGTTTESAQGGEIVIVGNAEDSMVAVAVGTNPDAATTASSTASQAGFPVPSGMISAPIVVREGDKVNIKAVS